jgi:hypothetical protein
VQGFCPLFVVSLAPIIAQIAGIALCRNAFWVGQQTLNNRDSHRRKVLRCLNDGRFRNAGNDDERDAEYNNANELLILFYHETIAPIFMHLFKNRRKGASLRRLLSTVNQKP